MDIGLLFDMENLDGTISHASYSNHDLAALLSNSSPISRSHSSPRNARAQMRSVPSFNNSQHEPVLWPSTSPLNVRSWPPEDDLQYTSPLQKTLTANTVRPSPSTIPSIQPPSSPTAPSRSQTNPRLTHASRTVPANPFISPTREDLSWQMYISSSLSLDFCDSQSPASLSLDDDNGLVMLNSLPLPPASLPSSASSDSLPTTINPALFLQLAPQGTSSLSTSRITSSTHHQGYAFSPWANETAQPRSQMTAILPDGTYAIPIAQPMPLNACSLPVVTASAASPASSPLRGPPFPIAQHKPSPVRTGQEISGWSGADYLQVPSFTIRPKRRRSSPSISPVVGMKRSAKRSPPASTTASEAAASTRSSKRSRRSASSRLNCPPEFDYNEQDEIDDDGDSDDYRPSRSASPDLSYSSLEHAGFPGDGDSKPVAFPRKKIRCGKGKAKGSAALALALVSQMGSNPHPGSELSDDIGVDVEDALALYQEGTIGIRKRKNHPIPLPIPVPNLNKKSRGRKVPYVADLSSGGSPSVSVRSGSSDFKKEEGSGVGSSYGNGLKSLPMSSSRRGPRRRSSDSNRSTPGPDDGGESRSFVCAVSGCGKCFVRGEHLKRHVRSIHTNDKPHPCPYEGCDKSFSRRDNLGQHVRIHLQP